MSDKKPTLYTTLLSQILKWEYLSYNEVPPLKARSISTAQKTSGIPTEPAALRENSYGNIQEIKPVFASHQEYVDTMIDLSLIELWDSLHQSQRKGIPIPVLPINNPEINLDKSMLTASISLSSLKALAEHEENTKNVSIPDVDDLESPVHNLDVFIISRYPDMLSKKPDHQYKSTTFSVVTGSLVDNDSDPFNPRVRVKFTLDHYSLVEFSESAQNDTKFYAIRVGSLVTFKREMEALEKFKSFKLSSQVVKGICSHIVKPSEKEINELSESYGVTKAQAQAVAGSLSPGISLIQG